MVKSIIFILSGISGLACTLVYILIIIKSIKYKRCGMPFFALAYNLSWELVYSILIMGDWNFQRAINLIWLIFDIIILITYLKYEKYYFPKAYLNYFIPWTLLGFATAFLIIYVTKFEFSGYLGAQYAAFIQNLMMSILFIAMFINRASLKGQSMGIAISKAIGTIAPTIMVVITKGSRLLITTGICVLLFDLVYICLIARYKPSNQF